MSTDISVSTLSLSYSSSPLTLPAEGLPVKPLVVPAFPTRTMAPSDPGVATDVSHSPQRNQCDKTASSRLMEMSPHHPDSVFLSHHKAATTSPRYSPSFSGYGANNVATDFRHGPERSQDLASCSPFERRRTRPDGVLQRYYDNYAERHPQPQGSDKDGFNNCHVDTETDSVSTISDMKGNKDIFSVGIWGDVVSRISSHNNERTLENQSTSPTQSPEDSLQNANNSFHSSAWKAQQVLSTADVTTTEGAEHAEALHSTESVSSKSSHCTAAAGIQSESGLSPECHNDTPRDMWKTVAEASKPTVLSPKVHKETFDATQQFKLDVKQTRSKLREVQQRFSNLMCSDSLLGNARPPSTSINGLQPSSPLRSSHSFEATKQYVETPLEHPSPLSVCLLNERDTALEEATQRARIAEEKLVELETDREFLVRECRQLKEKLSTVSCHEEELQKLLAESKLVALRDRQALEARHRDAMSELRRLLHDETSKSESLEERLRSERNDEQKIYEQEIQDLIERKEALQSVLEAHDVAELQSIQVEYEAQLKELRYWKAEYVKLKALFEHEQNTVHELHGQLEEQQNHIRSLETQLEDSEHDLVRLTEEEKCLRADLESRVQELASLKYEQKHEAELQQHAIMLMEKQIEGLQSDCRKFQKLLRQKEREMASEMAALCNRFSEMENNHETIVAQRIAEREAELREQMDSIAELRANKKCAAVRAKYESTILKLKQQLRLLTCRHQGTGRLKDYIKTEISRAVAETVHLRHCSTDISCGLTQTSSGELQGQPYVRSMSHTQMPRNVVAGQLMEYSEGSTIGTAIAADSYTPGYKYNNETSDLLKASLEKKTQYQTLSPQRDSGLQHKGMVLQQCPDAHRVTDQDWYPDGNPQYPPSSTDDIRLQRSVHSEQSVTDQTSSSRPKDSTTTATTSFQHCSVSPS